MVDILIAKLRQHPDLIEGINERGGLSYIKKSIAPYLFYLIMYALKLISQNEIYICKHQ